MKGFVIFSWIVVIACLICLPFAYQDMQWFGVGVVVIGGAMPLGSAVMGVYYWKELDDPKIQLKILQ